MDDNKDALREGFEWHPIAPRSEWFDPFRPRFFVNAGDRPVELGFGHNVRAIEIIVIRDVVEKSEKSGTLESLKGTVVKDDVEEGGEKV